MTPVRIWRLVVAIVLVVAAAYVFGWYIPQFYESTTTYLWAEALYIGTAAMGRRSRRRSKRPMRCRSRCSWRGCWRTCTPMEWPWAISRSRSC